MKNGRPLLRVRGGPEGIDRGPGTRRPSGSFESSREFRVTHLTDEKERIAQVAVEHLGTAETVFFDEGFHPLLVGRALPADRDLTIVTASLPTAIELAERPRTQVVVIGGRVRPITLASVERSRSEERRVG